MFLTEALAAGEATTILDRSALSAATVRPTGRRDAKRTADVLGNPAPGDLALPAGHLTAHRIQVSAQARHSLHRNQVLGRAGPVKLTVRQLPDQVPGRELSDGLLHLGGPDVVAAGGGAGPGPPPAPPRGDPGGRLPADPPPRAPSPS